MNIFDAGIKHAACALAIIAAESRFKHCAENGRAYLVPTKSFAGIECADTCGRVADKAIIFGKGNFFVEKPAINVGKRFQFGGDIIALIFWGVQDVEKILQGGVAFSVVKRFKVAEKLVGVENVRVAGVKAEDQPRTNFIKVGSRRFYCACSYWRRRHKFC